MVHASLVAVLMLVGAAQPAQVRPQPRVMVLLPTEEPPVAAHEVTNASMPTTSPAMSKAALPRSMVAFGQVTSFMVMQGTGALLVWAMLTLPVVNIVTGPLGVVGGALLLPIVTGTTAVIMGDYLSGDRHSLLHAWLASAASFWIGGVVTLVANAVLGLIAAYFTYSAVESARRGASVESLVRNGSVAPVLVMLGAMAAVDVVALAVLSVVPAAVTTGVLMKTREDVDAENKLPRML